MFRGNADHQCHGKIVLRSEQLSVLTDYALQLHAAEDYSELARVAVEAASRLVPCDSVVLTFVPSHFPLVRQNTAFGGADWERYFRDMGSTSHEDPVYTARLRLLLDRPASASEFLSPKRLAQTRLHHELWRPLGLVRQLSCLNPGPFSQAVILTRSTARDFTPDDAALVHALSRHIPAALSKLIRANGDRLPVNGIPVGVERLSWLVVDRDGTILRSQPEARNCMRLCLGPRCPSDQIPGEWLAELRRREVGQAASVFRYSAGRRSFSVHVAPIRGAPGEGSVVFVEYPAANDPLAALRRLGLTQREAEVMREMIAGRTNAQIGARLGISAATAKKHVENTLGKLGVPSRAAAVTRALTATQSAGRDSATAAPPGARSAGA